MKSIKNKISFYLLLLLAWSLTGAKDVARETPSEGLDFRLIQCGFSEDRESLYTPFYPGKAGQKQSKGSTIYFWMKLISYDDKYYRRDPEMIEPLPFRIKILSKTGIDYGRARSQVPIVDEKTYVEYNPDSEENFIYAYTPIYISKGYLSVNVVNLRNRSIICEDGKNCQVDIELQ